MDTTELWDEKLEPPKNSSTLETSLHNENKVDGWARRSVRIAKESFPGQFFCIFILASVLIQFNQLYSTNFLFFWI